MGSSRSQRILAELELLSPVLLSGPRVERWLGSKLFFDPEFQQEYWSDYLPPVFEGRDVRVFSLPDFGIIFRDWSFCELVA
jgi:hypothetical protein